MHIHREWGECDLNSASCDLQVAIAEILCVKLIFKTYNNIIFILSKVMKK